ncbi:MAG: hypothetical protein HW412_2028, partial [Bacteroidetes bacterium]|nr:hypothetical protein [Bacteroidota bacterium]
MAVDGKQTVLQEPTVYRTKIKDWPVDERP